MPSSSERYALKTAPGSSHRILASWLQELAPGARVFEVGPGPALVQRASGRTDLRWFAIERDLGVASALRGGKLVAWIGDVLEAQRFPGDLDAIVLGDVLEHLAAPACLLRALLPSLRRDGRVLISVPNVAHWWLRLSLLVGRFEYKDRGLLDRDHLRFFTARSLNQLLTSNGLRPTRSLAAGIPFSLALPRIRSRAVRALEHVEKPLLRLAPRMFAYQVLIEGRPFVGSEIPEQT
jgi:SAM-dependent methyltransferase